MLGRNQIVAFIPSSNLDRSRRFYEGTLGMKVLYQDEFALALDSRGTMIRVSQVGRFTPHQFTIFGWEVSNIGASLKKLRTKKIKFQQYGMPNQDENGIWTAPSGAKIAWFLDPDGNNLSISEFGKRPGTRKKAK